MRRKSRHSRRRWRIRWTHCARHVQFGQALDLSTRRTISTENSTSLYYHYSLCVYAFHVHNILINVEDVKIKIFLTKYDNKHEHSQTSKNGEKRKTGLQYRTIRKFLHLISVAMLANIKGNGANFSKSTEKNQN